MSFGQEDLHYAAILRESNFLDQIVSITRTFKPSLNILAPEPPHVKHPGLHSPGQKPHGEDRFSLKDLGTCDVYAKHQQCLLRELVMRCTSGGVALLLSWQPCGVLP